MWRRIWALMDLLVSLENFKCLKKKSILRWKKSRNCSLTVCTFHWSLGLTFCWWIKYSGTGTVIWASGFISSVARVLHGYRGHDNQLDTGNGSQEEEDEEEEAEDTQRAAEEGDTYRGWLTTQMCFYLVYTSRSWCLLRWPCLTRHHPTLKK